MAVSRLSCPECGTVLRPAKPVAPGKKVKCPKCEVVFVAGEEPEEDDDKPRKKPAAKKKAAPAVKAKEPAKKQDDEDNETYGYLKDPDLDNEDEDEKDSKKVKINYAEDTSVKDLRGPAIVKLTDPANYLQMVGFAGVLGYIILLVMLAIPALFPIKPDPDKRRPVMQFGPGIGAVNPQGVAGMTPSATGGGGGGGEKSQFEEEKGGFYEVYGVDLSLLCELAWYLFLVSLIPLFLLMAYSGLIVAGGIKMQNLESRGWAIAGAVMALFPMNTLGLQLLTAMVIQYGLGLIMDDAAYISLLANVATGLEYLVSVGIGIWCLITLWDKTVLAGFEYDPE